MLPCHKCAYHQSIPGNCHIQCKFDWHSNVDVQEKYPGNAKLSSHARQWFSFPVNYDPVWGPDECPAFSTERDNSKVVEFDPLVQLLSLLR